MKIYYHFTNNQLRDGRPLPAIGEWLHHDGPAKMCESGLHASPTAWDALQYAPGEMLHQVELKDIVEEQFDKVLARSRKIVATIDATELLRAFARKQALSVIHLWDCPVIVKEYLETGQEDIRAAARAAACAATRDAARDAARDATCDAARAAAWAATRDAARDAARAAAWDAARAAAWDATRDAARAAAWDATWAAARDAAWAATRDAAREQFNKMIEAAFEEAKA